MKGRQTIALQRGEANPSNKLISPYKKKNACLFHTHVTVCSWLSGFHMIIPGTRDFHLLLPLVCVQTPFPLHRGQENIAKYIGNVVVSWHLWI
jgi:hypothetical protein